MAENDSISRADGATPPLSRLLAQLDIPDCSCPRVPVLCPHKFRIAWNPESAEECAAASAVFAEAIAKGKRAFADGDEVKEFDPELGAIIFGPDRLCDCPDHIPPCRHILEAANHQLSPQEWQTLLRHSFPAAYDFARPIDKLSRALTLSARVATLIRRRRLNLSLWNNADWWVRKDPCAEVGKEGATRAGKRLVNGADDPEQNLRACKPSWEPPPPRPSA